MLRLLPCPHSHPLPKAPAGMNRSKWPKHAPSPRQLPLPLCVCWFHSRKPLHFISTGANSFPHSPSVQTLVIFLGLLVWVSGPSLGWVFQRPQEVPPPCEHVPHVCLLISLCLQVRAEMSIPSLEHGVVHTVDFQDGGGLSGFLPSHPSSTIWF